MSEQPLWGFKNAVERTGLRVRNVILVRQGEERSELHWTEDAPRNQYSVSKSFTSTAIGIAIDEGLLSLDQRVAEFFRDEVPPEHREMYREVTLRHLLTMSIGHDKGLLMAEHRPVMTEKDWVRFCFRQPVVFTPGSRFVYSNVNTYLAAVMLQRTVGQSLVEYLRPRFFEPLGIEAPGWETCPMGHTFGASGLTIRTRDLVKLGQLYLQRGIWDGRRIISERWVRDATDRQIDTSEVTTGEDWKHGYGYQFWRGTHQSFRADGFLSQFCLVLPKEGAVIAINSDDDRMQPILDCVWSEIVPLLHRGGKPTA